MAKHTYKAIVFDFDGTLVDSVDLKTKVFFKIFEKYNTTLSNEGVKFHKQNMGLSRDIKFRFFVEELLGVEYSSTYKKNMSQEFSELVVNEVIKCPYIDGSLEFLEINYKKIPIFLASATPSGELIEIINKRSMTHFFRGIYGSPMSKSEIITYIIDINKYNKMDVLMVGDSNADEVGASKAGVDFIKISRDSVKSFDTVSSVI